MWCQTMYGGVASRGDCPFYKLIEMMDTNN